MLPARPPERTVASVREGDAGWAVYAAQRALNDAARAGLELDGDFGPATLRAARSFQKRQRLAVDGVAGPGTAGALVRLLDAEVADAVPGVPEGLIAAWCAGEGGNALGAVNHYDPPGGPDGTDCGVLQYRCYAPYEMAALMLAFSANASMRRTARAFVERAQYFVGRPAVRNRPDAAERAKRLAVLAHNWPYQGGAYHVAETGRCSNPDGVAAWVPRGRVRFRDGHVVRTRWEWCQYYALGGPHGDGPIAGAVRSWA